MEARSEAAAPVTNNPCTRRFAPITHLQEEDFEEVGEDDAGIGAPSTALEIALSSAQTADFRPGLVHRLDKETSGLMIIALDPEALRRFQGLFKGREIQKTYIAVVRGRMEVGEKGRVINHLGRDLKNRQKFRVLPDNGIETGGKRAVSNYEW